VAVIPTRIAMSTLRTAFLSLSLFLTAVPASHAAVIFSRTGDDDLDLRVEFTETLTFAGQTNGGLVSSQTYGIALQDVFNGGRRDQSVNTLAPLGENSSLHINRTSSFSTTGTYGNSGRVFYSTGIIGINDLALRWEFGGNVNVSTGDTVSILPGVLILEDFLTYEANFPDVEEGDDITVAFFGGNGAPLASNTVTATVVPEPASGALLVLAGLALTLGRRRTRHAR